MGSAEDTWRLGIVMVSLPSSSTLRQEGLVWPSTAFPRSDEPIRNGYGLQVAMKPKLFLNLAMVVLGKTTSPSSAEADLLQEPLGESQKSPSANTGFHCQFGMISWANHLGLRDVLERMA